MKKIILLMMLCLTYGAVNAQKFVVTPEGLVNEADKSNFVILEFPGKTASDLYLEADNYYNTVAKKKKTKLLEIQGGKTFSFETNSGKLFFLNAGMGTKNWGAVVYTTQIDMKDGKVRLTFSPVELAPESDAAKFNISWKHGGMMNPGIFNKDGSVKQPDAKATIEAYFAEKIAEIKGYLSGEESKAAAKKNDW